MIQLLKDGVPDTDEKCVIDKDYDSHSEEPGSYSYNIDKHEMLRELSPHENGKSYRIH